jgi:hypothetical protein
MKLMSIHLPQERPKALGYVREIELARPVDDVVGWVIAVRGPSIVLIAPDGPRAGGYEVPRAQCTLRWDSTTPADYDKLANWTSEPLRRITDAPADAVKAAK